MLKRIRQIKLGENSGAQGGLKQEITKAESSGHWMSDVVEDSDQSEDVSPAEAKGKRKCSLRGQAQRWSGQQESRSERMVGTGRPYG